MLSYTYPIRVALLLFSVFIHLSDISAQVIMVDGKPGQLDIRTAGSNSLRFTLKPQSLKEAAPFSPAIALPASQPALSIKSNKAPVKKRIGDFLVSVNFAPLSITVMNKQGSIVQRISLDDKNNLHFKTTNAPLLGLGEGGPEPGKNVNWRELPVQFDRHGAYDSMRPQWQADAYGSRNPVPMIVGTDGWAIFVSTPWVEVDLTKDGEGVFIPWKPTEKDYLPQNETNQNLNLGKGLPPVAQIVPGLYDFFVFDAHDPVQFMQDFATITGRAAMPPRWALGYMQSHRTLTDEYQMIGVVDTFRQKQIPLDAVIYLGTGFAPRGWNTKQPSFDFNPEVFKRDPKYFFTDMHNRNVKVIVHMVPWDRDKLPDLHGSIPAQKDEVLNAGHIQNYWRQHLGLIEKGVDGFWPDEGDWFNLFERVKRHQLYYQGQLSTLPNVRPWSLQRNGYPGIAQWGGWVWSGDTESSWKTLEAQIAVGLNYSLSIGPYWGSDIGGFYSNPELTGELYVRWFQFGAFCGSFRSHGRTWRMRLPWGWGSDSFGPVEDRKPPLESELKNPAIEPVIKKYAELRYQLLPYTYTLAWEAYANGLPLMRALWLHYPKDTMARKQANEYLWGRDLLIAPVFEKNAEVRKIYLPLGDDWYDWWTLKKNAGGQTIEYPVDLSTLPILVKAGSIIPVDPVRQYTAQHIDEPTTLKIFSGKNAEFNLYDDDGISQEYLQKKGTLIQIRWNEHNRTISLSPGNKGNALAAFPKRTFKIELLPQGIIKTIVYEGKRFNVPF